MIIHFIKLLQEACHIRNRWEYPVKEIVHQFRSLWPPIYYHFLSGLNAIRSDEELGNLHSLYVDQWDWERVITNEDRNVDFLKEIVNRIYAAMIRTEYMVYEMYPQIKPCLPQKLHFIHSEELRQLYPNLEPKCREHAICQKYGAVFIIGIGCKLSDGKKHDGRAPDYDDYTSTGLNNLPGLNGDLLLWDDVLQRSIELSSMGVRVDKEALQRQLKEENEEERLKLYFHKRLMDDTLPLSIGGGIGQSRLCMFYITTGLKQHRVLRIRISGGDTCREPALLMG